MTTSRMGIMGSFFVSNFSLGVVTSFSKLQARNGCYRLYLLPVVSTRFLHHGQGDISLFHHFPCYLEFLHFLLAWQVEHEIEHELFQDHTQAAGPHFSGHCLAGDRSQSLLAKLQPYVLKFKQALVLLDDRILQTRENLNQGSL